MAGAPSSCRVLNAVVVCAPWSGPQSSSLGGNDNYADMSGVGSICAGRMLFYSLTSCALLRRKRRCVGKLEQQGAPLGPLVWMTGIPAWIYGVHSRMKQLCVGVTELLRFSEG